MKRIYIIAIVMLAICLSGCATKKYAWNNYDGALYQHYKNPTEEDAFIAKLKEIISDGEVSGKVPPGIYAEYGYVLYEKGQNDEAIKYFQKESDKWPESRTFMAKMISNTQMRNKTNSQETLTTNPIQ
jgi:hypothetical protein